MTDVEPLVRLAIAASGSVGLLWVFLRFVIAQDRKDDARDQQYALLFTDRLRSELASVRAELDEERKARREETRRCDRLEAAMRAHGIPIPEAI